MNKVSFSWGRCGTLDLDCGPGKQSLGPMGFPIVCVAADFPGDALVVTSPHTLRLRPAPSACAAIWLCERHSIKAQLHGSTGHCWSELFEAQPNEVGANLSLLPRRGVQSLLCLYRTARQYIFSQARDKRAIDGRGAVRP